MQKLSKLYRQIASMQNLWDAAWQTLLHGRRFKNDGASFKLNYEHSLLQIHKELARQSYKQGVGFRGGCWVNNATHLRTSDRADAAYTNSGRYRSICGRGVRLAP